MIESIKSMITNDSIQVISIIMPVWITFSIYLFNYSLKWSFGKIEIENNANDKLIPLLISIIFIFFTFLGGRYAYSLNNNSTTDLIAICSLLVMLIILLVIYFNKLNKSNKILVCKKTLGCNHICKIAFIFIMNIIVGIFIGFDAICIIKSSKDLHSIIFCIGSFIWIYYLTLMTSGLIFCETILSTLKLYELEYNEESIQCYLIGVFNDFLKIKDSKYNIRFINKDQIKEIREISTVDVKDNQKFKWFKKFIWGNEYEMQKEIKKLSKGNKENIRITYNKIYNHYNNSEYELEQYICRRQKLDIKSNGKYNLIYGIMGGLMVTIGTGIKNKSNIVIVVTILTGLIMNFIFFRPRYKCIRKDFLITKEKEILDKKIDELLNLNTSLICKEVEENGHLVKDKNELSNNKENIN